MADRYWSLLFLLFASKLRLSFCFLIVSYVPPNMPCNQTAGIQCFLDLYHTMPEICHGHNVVFKCVHYTYLSECFDARVGKCAATSVGQFANYGLQKHLGTCDHRKKGHRAPDGTTQLAVRPFPETEQTLNIVSSLGQLQTQCHWSKYKNCTSDHAHNIITQCEENMKPRTGYQQFDRHRLLRIKLDTSKKLLIYPETDKERECLVVRSIFSELFEIHQQHCFHSIVTRCMCERMKFNEICDIDCDKLEGSAPNQNQLAWDEWKRARLIRSSAQPMQIHMYTLLTTLLVLFFL